MQQLHDLCRKGSDLGYLRQTRRLVAYLHYNVEWHVWHVLEASTPTANMAAWFRHIGGVRLCLRVRSLRGAIQARDGGGGARVRGLRLLLGRHGVKEQQRKGDGGTSSRGGGGG